MSGVRPFSQLQPESLSRHGFKPDFWNLTCGLGGIVGLQIANERM